MPAIFLPFMISSSLIALYTVNVSINPPEAPASLLLNFISTFGSRSYSYSVIIITPTALVLFSLDILLVTFISLLFLKMVNSTVSSIFLDDIICFISLISSHSILSAFKIMSPTLSPFSLVVAITIFVFFFISIFLLALVYATIVAISKELSRIILFLSFTSSVDSLDILLVDSFSISQCFNLATIYVPGVNSYSLTYSIFKLPSLFLS